MPRIGNASTQTKRIMLLRFLDGQLCWSVVGGQKKQSRRLRDWILVRSSHSLGRRYDRQFEYEVKKRRAIRALFGL